MKIDEWMDREQSDGQVITECIIFFYSDVAGKMPAMEYKEK